MRRACGMIVKNDLENAAGRWKPEKYTAADTVDSEPARKGMSVL